MTLWMVRGDKHGNYQDMALEKGFAYHFSQVSDLKEAVTLEDVSELVREEEPDAKKAQIRSWAAQLLAIAHRIQTGDLVAMPLRSSPQIAIGRVKGQYQYRTDLGEVHHTLPVECLGRIFPALVLVRIFYIHWVLQGLFARSSGIMLRRG